MRRRRHEKIPKGKIMYKRYFDMKYWKTLPKIYKADALEREDPFPTITKLYRRFDFLRLLNRKPENVLNNKISKDYIKFDWDCVNTLTYRQMVSILGEEKYFIPYKKMKKYIKPIIGFGIHTNHNKKIYSKTFLEHLFYAQEQAINLDYKFWQRECYCPYNLRVSRRKILHVPRPEKYVRFYYESAYAGVVYLFKYEKCKENTRNELEKYLREKDFLFDKNGPFKLNLKTLRNFILTKLFKAKQCDWDFNLSMFLKEQREKQSSKGMKKSGFR